MIELLFALAAADPSADPATVCPQIERRPVARYADFPEIIRRFKGKLGKRDVEWNSTDVIHVRDPRPLNRYIAGGEMGGGRWLLVYESGGRMVFKHVEIWEIARDGRVARPASATSGSLDIACAEVAEQLAR